MNKIFSLNYKNASLIISIGILSIIMTSPLILSSDSLIGSIFYFNLYQEALAQQHQQQQQQSITNNSIDSSSNTTNDSNNKNNTTIVHASGHFANNQIKDGIVTWIQGGFWDLLINNSTDNNNKGSKNNASEKPNMTAAFNANFTMIKPDGSLSHSHQINNFNSTNVIFAGNDIIVTGIANIHSNAGLEFKQVPMTVHLMGKKVLGLTINVNKTNGHFASSNEMFGTLISGIGLNKTRS
jgi:hypothetical protein